MRRLDSGSWTMVVASFLLTCFTSLARSAGAQQPTGSITGFVRDSAFRPIADAEVFVVPGSQRTRTDAAGKFTLSDVSPGKLAVRARHLGYMPAEVGVKLAPSGRVEVTLLFTRSFVGLDTVVVTATGNCARVSIDGFMCRRRTGRGQYFDYNELARKEGEFPGDLLRGVDGFDVRYQFNFGGRGPLPTPRSEVGMRCTQYLVDGRPPNGFTNPMPAWKDDIVAMEAYRSSTAVPEELLQYAFSAPGRAARAPCALVVYWTWNSVRK